MSLGLLWEPGVGVLLLATVPFLLQYKIDRKRHRAIVVGLAIAHDVVSVEAVRS